MAFHLVFINLKSGITHHCGIAIISMWMLTRQQLIAYLRHTNLFKKTRIRADTTSTSFHKIFAIGDNK